MSSIQFDKNYVKSVVQNILDTSFKSQVKRHIHDYTDRLNFACPYCGDSSKSVHKKRGNLYFGKLFYVCFNCDKKTTFDRMCKDFNQSISPDKKLELIQYLESTISYEDSGSDFMDAKFDQLISLELLTKVINEDRSTPLSDLMPIQNDSEVDKYLYKRGIVNGNRKNIYQAKFWRNSERSEPVIVLLNRRDDKVLGIQIRNLKEDKYRFFKIYNWETLREWIGGEEIDISKTVLYNKLSYYFNILNVSFEDTITVFEGYIDSLFYPNSIGMVGKNTDTKFLESNGVDIQYFFDNDKAGFQKSEEKLKKGSRVFLWKKMFEDIVVKKRSDDPYKLMNRITTVKDLNALSLLSKNPYNTLSLKDYFSSDEFDLRWIPRFEKEKNLSRNRLKEKSLRN